METYTLDNDISLICVRAKSYPDGMLDAHKELHSYVPFSRDRRYFGLSRPEKGPIVYWAAAEEMDPGESEKYNSEALVLKNGTYISLVVKNFRQDPQSISEAFQKLLANPHLDPHGYCVEWYMNDEKSVMCMIRLMD